MGIIRINHPQNIVSAGLFVILVIALASLSADEIPSNCEIGSYCDRCQEGYYKIVNVESIYVKVCCPGCKKNFNAGNRESDGIPFCTCNYPEDRRKIKGTCWNGPQCEPCLNGPNKTYVGFINSIPVCCANCERSGLMLGGNECNCLHNGP
ncbi:uncharacterized protein LOC132716923 isoform X2 [Ruditapes philippinarum]|uniref:uncharacterized protein LOC132716923 isoform X2 n=1 Tax=Ruditapes philippinarum TaxID=129788 RepID=UPI00295B564D|nr:uncharacterized protein LOC132716923 isoform X2 [Ruditapes philippinarum]